MKGNNRVLGLAASIMALGGEVIGGDLLSVSNPAGVTTAYAKQASKHRVAMDKREAKRRRNINKRRGR